MNNGGWYIAAHKKMRTFFGWQDLRVLSLKVHSFAHLRTYFMYSNMLKWHIDLASTTKMHAKQIYKNPSANVTHLVVVRPLDGGGWLGQMTHYARQIDRWSGIDVQIGRAVYGCNWFWGGFTWFITTLTTGTQTNNPAGIQCVCASTHATTHTHWALSRANTLTYDW